MIKKLLIAIMLLAGAAWVGLGDQIGESLRDARLPGGAHLPWFSGASDSDLVARLAPQKTNIPSAGLTNPILLSKSQETADFLESVAAQLKQSLPFETEVKIDFSGFGQHLQLSGTYIQAGQGSGQSRLELNSTPENRVSDARILKICDGRFLYTHLNFGGQQSLEFIDLGRLQTARKTASTTKRSAFPKITEPVESVLDGCLASLLENLAQGFEFEELKMADLEGISICTVRGQWNRKHLAALLNGSAQATKVKQDFRWAQLPRQIPRTVELKLANLPEYGWMPQSVSFARAGQGGGGKSQLVAVAQFTPPKRLTPAEGVFLNVQNDEVEAVDVTDRYVDQILGIELIDD